MTDSNSPPGMPRWVIVLGIAAIVLVLVMGVLHLTGISPGGPGSHLPNVEHSTQQP
jgi:hypothetical protein